MIRSFVAQASALLASAALAFLLIAPVAVPSAEGGTVTFPASCTSWTPGGGTSGTLATNVAATTTYSVTATDAAGATSTKSVTVTVSNGAPPPPPGGGGTALCAQYANVLPIVNATFGQQASFYSQTSGNFGDNAVWVIQLTVPAGTPTGILASAFTVAEYQGTNTPRQLTLSTQACDFRTGIDPTGSNGPLTLCQDGSSCQVSYIVQPLPTRGAGFGMAYLTAGQTYYINVRNYSNYPTPGYDCGLTSCNAIMNYQP